MAESIDHATLEPLLTPWLGSQRWYIAYSGGLDSSVLLHMLALWRDRHPQSPSLHALHINHHLQVQSNDWAAHCQRYCKQLDVPLQVVDVDVAGFAGSVESAAREARYRAFDQHLNPQDLLLLAHHLDDQVETFFLRLMRGAGIDGLSGMRQFRSLPSGAKLLRPLLQLERAVLERYAEQHGVSHINDPSNKDARIDRNYLRSEVLPKFAAHWPAYRSLVSRAASNLANSARLVNDCDVSTQHNIMGDSGIAVAELALNDAVRAMQQLRSWLKGQKLRMPSLAMLAEFIRQLGAAEDDAAPVLNCADYTLRLYRGVIYQLPGFKSVELANNTELGANSHQNTHDSAREAVPLAILGDAVVSDLGRFSLEPTDAESGFAYRSGDQLELRWRQGGERCRPQGRQGSVSLKKLLQELAVPPWWRKHIPLVYRNAQLVAIADLCRCKPQEHERALEGEEQASVQYKRLVWSRL